MSTDVQDVEAGCEMDALIDERVFGYEWKAVAGVGLPPGCTHRLCAPKAIGDFRGGHIRAERYADGRVFAFGGLPYSTDIGSAWLVVENMVQRGWAVDVQKRYPLTWACHIIRLAPDYLKVFEHEQTAPLAICRAALVALPRALSRSPETSEDGR